MNTITGYVKHIRPTDNQLGVLWLEVGSPVTLDTNRVADTYVEFSDALGRNLLAVAYR